jgi:ribose transport system ATP-binding protein
VAERIVLTLDGIEKSFGPVSVLRGVTLSVAQGTVHALLGENGAGKSTLMRILLGVETADRGSMKLGSEDYRPRAPGEARTRGVVMVPQERTLCPDLTVAENIVLGLEPTFGRAPIEPAERALSLVTGDTGKIALDAYIRDLRVADQQLVEIARALAHGGTKAKVLVLDEPTASLGHDDAARLFERVHALRESGVAVILVTHFLRDVRDHADRYTVLRDGKVAGEGDPKTTAPEQIVSEMLGSALAAARAASDETEAGDVLLDVNGLAGEAKPRSVTFTLRRGEIFGIAGVVGSGRTETLRAILGLDRRTAGKIDLRAPKGVGLLSEDRGGEGLMLGRSIAENVTLSKKGPLFELPQRVLDEGARWIERLKVKAAGPNQDAGDLSGGNQQKVQIARLLREDYDVLLVDEPTRGIDVASKAQVMELLRDLAKQGKGIVLVSSQLEELVSTCDRIAVLKDGKLGEPKPANAWTEESLLLEASS